MLLCGSEGDGNLLVSLALLAQLGLGLLPRLVCILDAGLGRPVPGLSLGARLRLRGEGPARWRARARLPERNAHIPHKLRLAREGMSYSWVKSISAPAASQKNNNKGKTTNSHLAEVR